MTALPKDANELFNVMVPISLYVSMEMVKVRRKQIHCELDDVKLHSIKSTGFPRVLHQQRLPQTPRHHLAALDLNRNRIEGAEDGATCVEILHQINSADNRFSNIIRNLSIGEIFSHSMLRHYLLAVS